MKPDWISFRATASKLFIKQINYVLSPGTRIYASLEADEFWICVQKKSSVEKQWPILVVAVI